MNIRKFCRLGFLTLTSLFWASCGTDSNPQFPSMAANPDSSADNSGSSSSVEPASSSSADVESSSDVAQPSSSTDNLASSSAEAPVSSANVASSSSVASSASASLVLAKNPSVTCTKSINYKQDCPTASPRYSCDDLQILLKKDTTLSEKILTSWEEKLESCGVVQENEPVYGITYPVCPYIAVNYLRCSDGKNYDLFKEENGVAYTTESEYYETHSSAAESSSSVAASSSSVPKDFVKTCPQSEFVMFADILADVQTTLYEKIAGQLENDSTLTEKGKEYLESLLDREKKCLKGNLAPYYPNENCDVFSVTVYNSAYWFNGYIAKFKTCEDGTPSKTERYMELRGLILAESLDLISKNVKKQTDISKAAE